MRTMTITQAMNEALLEEMNQDESVYAVGLGLSTASSGATAGLIDEFGPLRV